MGGWDAGLRWNDGGNGMDKGDEKDMALMG